MGKLRRPWRGLWAGLSRCRRCTAQSKWRAGGFTNWRGRVRKSGERTRQVEVSAISIDEIALPYLRLTVDCGKGTYLRSIAHDLGQTLGCGGYVTQLSRLSCGQFKAENSVTLESLAEAAAGDGWQKHLHPVD